MTRCNSPGYGFLPVIFLAFLYFSSISVFSQSFSDIRFSNITKSEGLPSDNVRAVVKDHLGFIWVGTNNGLCRYDAPNRFTVFRANEKSNPNGLKSNDIKTLLVDKGGNIWIGTTIGGLSRYQPSNNTWKNFSHDPKVTGTISSNDVLSLIEDSKGRIWVGTENGLNLFHPDSEHFTSFKTDDKIGLLGNAVLSILEDDQSRIWLGTWGEGIHLMLPSDDGDIKKTTFRRFLPRGDWGAKNIWSLYQDSRQQYWLGTFGAGLFLMELPSEASDNPGEQNWEPSYGNFEHSKNNDHSIGDNFVKTIFEDRENNLWLGTSVGLFHLKKEELALLNAEDENGAVSKTTFYPKFEKHEVVSLDPQPQVHSNVNCIFQDDQNLLWVGADNGLSYYNWYLRQFDFIDVFSTDVSPDIYRIHIDKEGKAWMKDDSGDYLTIDLTKEESSYVRKRLPNQEAVLDIYGSGDNEIYFVSDVTINVLHKADNTWKTFELPKKFQDQGLHFNARCLYAIENELWIGAEVGVFIVDRTTGEFKYFKHDPEDPKSLSDNSITDIIKDSKGSIWVSSFRGLNLVQKDANGNIYFRQYKNDPDDENSIPANSLTQMVESNGQLFIGSSIGLLGYNLETEIFTNYNQGKNQYSIQSVKLVDDGSIWGSTTEGLFYFNQGKNQFNLYGKQDGVRDINFILCSSYADKDGHLYFTSRNGITRIHPNQIESNQKIPPVYITSVQKMNPSGEIIESVVNTNEVKLNHDDYHLSVNFSALNYNRAEKNLYQYKLEGFDENWIPLENNTNAVYTNLDPGTYQFKVQASNNDGIWNKEGDILSIVKHAVFYETMAFKIGALLLAIALMIFGNKLYNRSILQRNQEMERIVKDRTKELQCKNAEVKILVEKMKERNGELEAIVTKRTEKLKETNDELIRSNNEYERFAYIASHDLQEPLRTVGSFVSLLDKKYQSQEDENTKKYMHFITDGVKRMSHLIQSLLSYSRVGSGEIQMEETKLNDVVSNKLQDLSQKIEEKNAIVKVNQLPTVFCEPNQVGMIFYNLINNAMKFNKKEQPIVEINCDSDAAEGFWKFSVRDNGIGIAPEDQQKIFEVFQRLHNKSEFEGTGIGLATVQKIIAQHEGKIWLESVVGVGTTFYFTIAQNDLSNKEEVLEELQVEA